MGTSLLREVLTFLSKPKGSAPILVRPCGDKREDFVLTTVLSNSSKEVLTHMALSRGSTTDKILIGTSSLTPQRNTFTSGHDNADMACQETRLSQLPLRASFAVLLMPWPIAGTR